MHRDMPLHRRWWAVAGLVLLLAGAAPVRAYEDSWTVGAAAAWLSTPAAWLPDGVAAASAGIALEASRGLDDAWSVRLEGGYAPHLRDGGPLAHEAWAGLDMLYALDLLDVVPYVAVGVGSLWPAAAPSPLPVVRLSVGADWLIDWTHQLGLEVSQRFGRAGGGRWEARTLLALRFGFRFED